MLARLNSRLAMWFFMLTKLPAAWFMGVRIQQVTLRRGAVTLPYRWRSQNPFRSTYFAAQMAAGEMSTGILILAHIDGRSVSMLVQHIEADFLKKVSETLTFVCEDGDLIQEAVENTLTTGEAQLIRAKTNGYLPNGQVACTMFVVWGVKKRS